MSTLSSTPFTDISEFSSEGFNVGSDSRSLTYLHGLSDFWTYIFDDASKVNTLLEANALTSSDVYNKFLQLTSGISLEDISVLTNAQIKLVLISDPVPGKIQTYYLPTENGSNLVYAKTLANRAFLPTSVLENGLDFQIDISTNQISFAGPIADLKFPVRILPSGLKQYAVWAIDAKVDDNLIYNHYGKLIGIDPTKSSELFKNFVYGMYYLFLNGPNLATLRKGFNLALGVPLARDVETVLEIQKYVNTDQYLVITDNNSYLVPYGLTPSVEVGQVLSVGDEISTWVEVKDYESDGEWWINFMIPVSIMPFIPSAVPGSEGETTPESQVHRYATKGSYADWLMRNYLKKHTFLVNIKTISFKNLQNFEQLSSIINAVKPAHTTPIYVWTLQVGEEILNLVETFSLRADSLDSEALFTDLSNFTRDSTIPFSRGVPGLIRMSAPAKLDYLLGRAPEVNGISRSFNGGVVTGFVNPYKPYAIVSSKDTAWVKALRTRDQDQYVLKKGSLDYFRDMGSDAAGTVGANPMRARYPGFRIVYLHTTTERDVLEKFNSVGISMPSTYIFDMLKSSYRSGGINTEPVDGSVQNSSYAFLYANFNYLFSKGTSGQKLGALFPADSYVTFNPSVSDLRDGDFLVFSRIGDGCVGVFWATTNFQLDTPPYIPHQSPDALTMTITGPVTRGMAPHGSPYYAVRSGGSSISYNKSNELNRNAINTETLNYTLGSSSTVTSTFMDGYNPIFTMDRSGNTLVTNKAWR